MDLENLKSDYQKSGNENPKSIESINKMKQSKNHPVLKRMRRQLVFESVIWVFVLIVYYDFFDGHLKSILWNVLLVISILLLLSHNLLGYIIAKSPINGKNLSKSLQVYADRIKNYAIVSIASRILAVLIFIGFLTSSITWNTNKIITIVSFITIVIAVQIYFLGKIWKGRIEKIEYQIDTLK